MYNIEPRFELLKGSRSANLTLWFKPPNRTSTNIFDVAVSV